jgi:bifunctional non-homologous end joining protein LigD
MLQSIKPMLAELGSLPLNDDAWAFELKWDGIRAVSYLEGKKLRIESRNGNDLSSSFPELDGLKESFAGRQLILDGEIVSFGADGRPSFQALQPRIHSSDRRRSLRLADEAPVTYVVFDLLFEDGEFLLDEFYDERRRRLEALGLEKAERLAVSTRFEGPGKDVFAASKQQGLEGIVCKKRLSPYRPGRRSPEWTKVKNTRMQEVVIGGYTAGQGRRRDRIGSLLLGLPDEKGRLTYIGQVGTGFSEESLSELARRLGPLATSSSPFSNEVPSKYSRDASWVEPLLVGEVTFGEWTKDGRLRHPSWRGLREDKEPKEVVREPQ